MSLLPGVPNMGPAPVSPTGGSSIKAPPAPHVGKQTGIAATAFHVGKPARTEHVGNLFQRHRMPGAGGAMNGTGAPITGGSALGQQLGHYGKMGLPGLTAPGAGGSPAGIDPTMHPGATAIRGGSGRMKPHLREGGLGPGEMGAPGTSTDYSMQDMDPE